MQVRVALFSYFQQGRFAKATVVLPENATVADLLTQLKIDILDVGVLVVNGVSGRHKDRLETGDRVTVIPFIGGG